MAIKKNGLELLTLEAWERHAGPKSPRQWVDGRSAKEAARAWLEAGLGTLPIEVSTALEMHASFGVVRSWNAEPEAKLAFDAFMGEPRNSDLVVHAEDAQGPFLIAVEAKADEPFGETVSDTLAAALERYLSNNRSNGISRVQQLAQSLLGARGPGDPSVRDLRYQLLTATAGALCEAERRGYSRALLLIQEFHSVVTEDQNHARNAAALDAFLWRLTRGSVSHLSPGQIRGPFVVPGRPLLNGTVQLFIGKVTRDIRG